MRAQPRMPRFLNNGAILWIAFAAAAASQALRAPAWVVQGVAVAGLLWVSLARRDGAREWLAGFGRRPALVAAIAAIAVAAPTLRLSYFADDYCLLEERGQRSLLGAILPTPMDTFLRPLGWASWWIFGRLF